MAISKSLLDESTRSFYDLLSIEVDRAIAEQQRKAMEHFTIRTPVGDMRLRADPRMPPGQIGVYRAAPVPGSISFRCVAAEWDGIQCEGRITRAQDPNAGIGWRCPRHNPREPIDGITKMQCYTRWSDNRAIVERGGAQLYRLTPAQIAAGRAAYLLNVLDEWSTELRAKVAASAERDRNEVRCDLQDEP